MPNAIARRLVTRVKMSLAGMRRKLLGRSLEPGREPLLRPPVFQASPEAGRTLVLGVWHHNVVPVPDVGADLLAATPLKGDMAGLISERDAADFLLADSRERGEVLTNLKLQKLLYYAQAWHLAEHGRALFQEDFQAWIHGPVLPSQYRRFKRHEWRPILDEVRKPMLDERAGTHLGEIVEEFGSETAVALELMTHRELPWVEARGGIPATESSTAPIRKDTMKRFYKDLAKAA